MSRKDLDLHKNMEEVCMRVSNVIIFCNLGIEKLQNAILETKK